MTTLMDGINNAYLLTAQINALKSQGQTAANNPEAIKYMIEQNFSQMLDDLVSSSDNDEEDKNKDPFSEFMNLNQAYLQNVQAQQIGKISSPDQLIDTSSEKYLNSLYSLGQTFK